MSKQKSNKFYLVMGVVFAVSLVFILLGTLAGVSLYNVFEKESEIVGNAKIDELPGDEEKIVISDDENVFFSYVYPMFVFDKTDYTDGETGETKSVYNESKTTNRLQFLPEEKDYVIFINGKRCVTVKEKGMVSSQVTMLFMNEHGEEYPALFTTKFVFYSDRTVFSISFRDTKVGGYLNRMAQTGFNVRVVESPATENPKFEPNGLDGFKIGEELPDFYINTSLIPSAMWFEDGVGETIISGENFSIYCGIRESYINYKDSNGISQYLYLYNKNYIYGFDFCFLPDNVSYIINEISGVDSSSIPMWSRWISSKKFSDTSACEKKEIMQPEIHYNVNYKDVTASIDTSFEIGKLQIYKGTELLEESTNSSNSRITIDMSLYAPGKYTAKAQSLSGNSEMFLDSNIAELQFEIKAEDILERGRFLSKLYVDTSPEGTAAMKATFNEVVPADSYLETICASFRLNSFADNIYKGDPYLELCFLRLSSNDFCLLFHNARDLYPGMIGDKPDVKIYTVVYSTKAGEITIGNTKLQAVAGWQNLDEDGGIIYEYPRTIYVNWVNGSSYVWANYKSYIKSN